MSRRHNYDLICLVTNDLSHDRRMLRTCDSLSAEGWRILIIGRELKKSSALPELSFDLERVQCTFHSGPLFYIEILFRFRRKLKQLNFTRLLCADIDTIGVLQLIDTKQKEVFFDAHELFIDVPELQGKKLKRYIWKKWASYAMKYVDHAYTVGQSVAEVLSKRYNQDFEVVRNVPNSIVSPIHPPISSDKIRLVYLGVLNPDRGLDILIPIVSQLEEFHLTIIGDGPQIDYLKALASDNSRVHFAGMVKPQEVKGYLEQADVGVNLLAKTSLNYYYSLANKFFDYINSGLPVLCMNYPEYQSIGEQYDCIYPVENLNSHDVKEVLTSIQIEIGNYSNKSSAAREAALNFHWENEENTIKKMFGIEAN